MSDIEPVVAYSIKDLLDGINRKLDAALAALLSKADAVRVEALEQRLTAAEAAIAGMREHAKERRERREWFIPALCGVIMAAGTILQLIHW